MHRFVADYGSKDSALEEGTSGFFFQLNSKLYNKFYIAKIQEDECHIFVGMTVEYISAICLSGNCPTEIIKIDASFSICHPEVG